MAIGKFYRDSFILTVSNLFTGIIGFVFSILLSKKLGAEGLGLYGLIMPVYGLFLCLASDGLTTALSKISAVYFSRKDFKNLNRTMSATFIFIFMWSLAIAFLVFINSSLIGSYIIKDIRSLNALKVICPAVVFVSLSAILKGYFYGLGEFKIAALIDVLEKVLRLAALLGTIEMLSLRYVGSTVTAAYFALAAGECVSFLSLYTAFRIYRERYKTIAAKQQNGLQLLYNVLVISFPLCVNGFVSSLFSTASTLVIPRRLLSAGFPYESVLSLIGKFLGMSFNITSLPAIIIGSISTVLVPDLSISIARNNSWEAEKRIAQVLKIAGLVGISTLVVCLSIPDQLGLLFYSRADLGRFIRFAAISSVIGYMASPTFGMLNGLGKQNTVLKNSIIVSAEGLVFIYIFTGIPAIHIYGYGISIAITSVTALILNIREIKKVCEPGIPALEAVAYALAGGVSYSVLSVLKNLLPDTLIAFKAGIVSMSGFFLVFSISRLASRLIVSPKKYNVA